MQWLRTALQAACWLALLSCVSATGASTPPPASAGVFGERPRDSNTTTEAARSRKVKLTGLVFPQESRMRLAQLSAGARGPVVAHEGFDHAYDRVSTNYPLPTNIGDIAGFLRNIHRHSATAPLFLYTTGGRKPTTPRLPLYNFVMVSWGPGWLLYAVMPPKWNAPNCLNTHYTRRFRANYTQNQPVWMRDSFSCKTFFLYVRRRFPLVIHYPAVPCPHFMKFNHMCHLIGDHIAVQPWERWADYSLYIDVMYSRWDYMDPRIPYDQGFGRTFHVVRIHNCDPTKDCFTMPRANWSNLGFDFSTTPWPSSTKSVEEKNTTTTPIHIKTLPSLEKPKEIKIVCPEKCKSRRWAEILWPVFFVTTLLVAFGVLPCIYICAKNRTERQLMSRWYRASSESGGTTFLLKLPPTWSPGWPPGPSTGEPSRTDPEGRWRSGTGPPPAKRRRRF